MVKITLEKLLEAGVHFGHTTSRWNPKMAPFIYDTRGGIHIIDLVKTQEKLKEALNFIKEIIKKGGLILFVGTKRQAQKIIQEEAQKCQMPYINSRWLGGTLTNFETISFLIKKYQQLKEFLNSEESKNFLKKERQAKELELSRLEEKIGGISQLRKLPEALFIVDVNWEKVAVAEAQKLDLPIVALVDTNGDPEEIAYPIPSNDDASKAIKLMVGIISEAIREAQGKPKKATPKEEEEKILEEEKV